MVTLAFSGTQGDGFDTQGDMFRATIGATCLMLLLKQVRD